MGIITTMRRTVATAACFAIAPAVGLVAVANSSIATAASEQKPPAFCGSEVQPMIDPGRDAPVILVHGIGGSGGDRGDFGATDVEKSFANIVNTSKRSKVVQSFNYSEVNNQWVTHPKIGSLLAKTVVCAGRWSSANGGPGRVVLVGRSMGGLAILQAYTEITESGPAGNYYGKVITIGTPYQGSMFANAPFYAPAKGPGYAAMRPGSAQLRSLPKYSRDLPVYTIAGDIVYSVTNHARPNLSTKVSMGDDSVVSVKSATAAQRYTHKYGGGAHVFECGMYWEALSGRVFGMGSPKLVKRDDSCDHFHQRGEKFANEVKKSIERYTEALPEPDVWVNPTMPPMPPYTPGA